MWLYVIARDCQERRKRKGKKNDEEKNIFSIFPKFKWNVTENLKKGNEKLEKFAVLAKFEKFPFPSVNFLQKKKRKERKKKARLRNNQVKQFRNEVFIARRIETVAGGQKLFNMCINSTRFIVNNL